MGDLTIAAPLRHPEGPEAPADLGRVPAHGRPAAEVSLAAVASAAAALAAAVPDAEGALLAAALEASPAVPTAEGFPAEDSAAVALAEVALAAVAPDGVEQVICRKEE